jgi:biopolymer transport protein ExbD
MGAAVSPGRGGGRAGIVGINVTPMVDVVLVLLVIMMVSANFIVSQSMKVDLPKASNSDGAAGSPAAVAIGRDGSLTWNDAPVSEAELRDRLAAAFSEDPETSLVVSADAAAAHGAVVHVMDLAKASGITKFAIGIALPE